jgi:hypothetical protein
MRFSPESRALVIVTGSSQAKRYDVQIVGIDGEVATGEV